MATLTADEFLGGIVEFEKLATPLQTDLLAYFAIHYAGTSAVTAASLASLRNALHLPEQRRLPQYLSEQTNSPRGKPPRYVRARDGYVLERAYSRKIEQTYLGRPASRAISSSLRGTLHAVGDPAVKSYLDEAISCFEHHLFRAAVVMTWCVAFGLIRGWLFRNHLAVLNAEMAKWKVPLQVTKLDDFQDLNEATIIDTARKLRLLTKEQHKTLKQLLDERNSYAHPTLKAMTPAIAEAYIERVQQDVIPYFG